MSARTEQEYIIDQAILKQQEELSMQISNLHDKSTALSQQKDSNKGAQALFTSNKLKDEKKIFYLASNNFMKMGKETAFKILEKEQAKVLFEKKKIDQQLNQVLLKLSKIKPYVELLDLDVQELLFEFIKENEDD